MNADQARGSLDLLLLGVLEAGPAHGYAIIEALRERSEGAFDLAEGTIYPALHRLEEGGLLASRWTEQGGRRRRVYRLTRRGASALRRRRHDWSEFTRAVNLVLEAGP